MPRTIRYGAAAALMTLLFALNAGAQEKTAAPAAKKTEPTVAELEAQSRQAYQDQNWVRLYAANMRLNRQRPFVPEYMVNIVLGAAALDRKQTAYHYMLQMQQQGLAYDFNDYPETEKIRSTQAYDHINNLLIEAGNPAGEGAKLFSLDVKPADLGDVAWDPTRERFLVGTRSAGKLLAVDDNGKAEVLLQADKTNGLWSIDGLAVDADNKRLWISSTATPVFNGFDVADARRGGLFEFDLETLEPVATYNLPADSLRHELGGIALTRNGDVYVIDRATPIVYRKAPEGTRLEAFAGGPQMVAFTDIATTPDNSRVFVADAALGILLIDPLAQRSAMLGGPETLNLSGIYNVEFAGGQLIVTQSGIKPQRILRLELDRNGAQVETVTPMASSLDGFDTPGVGAIRDGSMYYFANHGSPEADELLMMATPLNAGDAVKPPDMDKFEQAIRQSSERAEQQ